MKLLPTIDREKWHAKKTEYFHIAILMVTATALRISNLGYSDYQGDEIKALFIKENLSDSTWYFLLTQRKGPIQYLITYLLKFYDPTYSDEYLIRFAFAAAGIAAVFFFYKFVKLHFSEKVAFYAALFVATNGLFVAFSRIVQYQSFVILFMVLALYFFSLAVKKKSWEIGGIYLGFIFWALSILSHYDGVLIFPFAAYLLFAWLRKETFAVFKITNLKHLIVSGVIFLVMLGSFYIPFIEEIDHYTKSYWQGRISGEGGKTSDSSYLFSIYQPIYVLHLYRLLFVLGLAKLATKLLTPQTFTEIALLKTKKLAGVLLLLLDDRLQKAAALLAWILVPIIFLEVLVTIPGTHIYTYLLPATIMLGFGLVFIEDVVCWVVKLITKSAKLVVVGRYIVYTGIVVLFSFIFVQSYAVFVDHTQEYPWEEEQFFIWTLNKPSPVFHLSLFGFPYYRSWDGIGAYIHNGPVPPLPCPGATLYSENAGCWLEPGKRVEHYTSNERNSISRHYVSFPKESDAAGYYVHIVNPQSLSNEVLNDKSAYWAKYYPPVWISRRMPLLPGQDDSDLIPPTTYIYYMPQGTLSEIKAMGY